PCVRPDASRHGPVQDAAPTRIGTLLMRVLMVSKALVTGVYQKKLEELAALPDLELLAIVPPFWSESRVGAIPLKRMFTNGYDLAVEEMRFNGRHHLHYYPGLAKQMRRFKPDLVHIDEEPYNLVCAQATRLARRAKARTIFFTWQNLDRRYPPPFSLFERYSYSRASAALAGNEDARRVLRRKGFEQPIEVIPQFGVDPEIFSPRQRPPASSAFTIGYYGRLVPEKGIDTLIEAVAHLPSTARTVIVGSGESLASLRELAQRLGVVERVEFRGPIPAETIPDFLAELDVVVVPSRTRPNWKEQFGRVIIEAMACQTPVIGSDSGEIQRVIGNPDLVFPEGDSRALAARIQSLIDDPERTRQLGLAGRQRVLGHYTQAQVAAATYRVYQSVLGETALTPQPPLPGLGEGE
ncbi:MAG: glycosyltransferase, partial [Thermomicrobiales bacterium]